MTFPAYLAPIQAEVEYYWGHLEYQNGYWVIIAEPAVLEFAKRVFPGSRGRGQEVRFPDTRRAVGDLNWLMMRYPLRIDGTARERWEWAYAAAVQHAERRRANLATLEKATPAPEFCGELRPFQAEGLAYLLLNRRSLLADEMGLGKTVQALAWLATLRAYPALLVVPSHLIHNWRHEIDRFLRLPKRQGTLFDVNDLDAVHVIRGLTPYKLPAASIYIIHYGLLRGWKHALQGIDFQAVIFDEIQELRHTGTEKYSAASLLAQRCQNVIGLSGTPIYNRGGEIWAVMNIIEYHCLGDWDSFTREWCDGYGSDVVKDPALLGDYLRREGLMLRRRKEDVLAELPPKRRVVQVIDYESGIYGALIQDAIGMVRDLDTVQDALARGRMMREIEGAARQAIGIAKAPHVAAFVKLLLEAGERVLLFGYHHRVFDIYMDALREFKPVRITGTENETEKARAARAFMEGETNVIVISLRTTAGLNLQRGTCAVFGELDWSPAIHAQAEDRLHRIGQRGSVLAYYLVAEEGTDEAIQQALGLKVSQFVGIMGDRAESEDDRILAQQAAADHLKRVVAQLRVRAGLDREPAAVAGG